MEQELKVIQIDATTGYYRHDRYPVGQFMGPVDLGYVLSSRTNSLNFGAGLLAGSIFPGSNRLVFTGKSPCWHGFYISSMGGAALVFDNLGVNMVSITGQAPRPSILVLNRNHGEEIEVDIVPVELQRIWSSGRRGVYSLMDTVMERYGDRYRTDPRILAVGPAAATTDIGAIVSVPIKKGVLSYVDTWAGRGGLGSKLLQEHGICAVIYGGTVIDEDFRDRKVADKWFQDKYQKKLAAKDFEATAKYRYEPGLKTGGTLGVNLQTLAGKMLCFNYRSINWSETDRLKLHEDLVLNHYLKQFNDETIAGRHQSNCGEPCAAVCKKMWGHYKKDYEPYQTMGPLTGIFDQRAAEMLNHHCDTLGMDAISAGGVLAWLFDCVAEGLLKPEDVGLSDRPNFDLEGFDVVADSMHNARLGVQLLDRLVDPAHCVSLKKGARHLAWKLTKQKNNEVINRFVYTANGRRGWMVPNQYWTPGALSPMAIMGKYYMYYGFDYVPPRELGRVNAHRFQKELILDNLGICRFHRKWAEEMAPEIIEHLYGNVIDIGQIIGVTAGRINGQNSAMPWETQRCGRYVHTFLKRMRDIEGITEPSLLDWLDRFEKKPEVAALDYWYELHRGMTESLRSL